MKRYKPNVTVACVIKCQDKYLMVEELIEGQLRYNQPAGHLEANESLLDACIREVYEETGVNVNPTELIGIYQFSATNDLAFLRFSYFCELLTQQAPLPQDAAINRALWLSLTEIKALKSQLRSPLVLQCIEDQLSGKQFSTDVVNCQFL
ncbi:NUDIX hydrolase [Shewanella psychrotolerans]|uniref:NUDIX hydrolase n=1 Tax=Shewanella psychrotolerans TaxID=2864206 RepID=UPI001C6575C5|nr:NUDIX hydrolase [Shewanella psychrotolerans]QYK02743.1 NUDIX hydrolase [Shewanella psychrotolerans]